VSPRPLDRRVRLGRSSLSVAPLALGTWAWGERKYWGYEQDFTSRDVVDAFVASADAGVTLLDTAEVYGHGESEKITGFLLRKRGEGLQVATKFALLPGRDGARALPRALDLSLKRLGIARIDLYQIHWPDTAMASIEALMDALADAVEAGKIGAVGVSNFTATETRAAHAALARRGIPLASNQVHYSLIHRAPEADGVLDACRELDVALLAYSPLEQGILSGKYAPGRVPEGPRARLPSFAAENLVAAGEVVKLLGSLGESRGSGPDQVALAWLMAQPGVVPIAGAKTGAQAERNAAAAAITLDAAEIEAIDVATTRWKRA
jgi:aryl-alcohol dehydrogenase-like predicted oxidoreductase